jgi:ribonuclease P protein component
MRDGTSLTKRSEFHTTCTKGRRVTSDLLTVYGLARADGGPARLGLAVSGRGLGAVRRNRIRRRVRAAWREAAPDAARDHVVRARPEAADAPFAALVEELRRSLASLDRGNG